MQSPERRPGTPVPDPGPVYWLRLQPQVAVKSFPAEPIRALLADQEGSYLIGGGSNGNLFLWEVRAFWFLADGWKSSYCWLLAALSFEVDVKCMLCAWLVRWSEMDTPRWWIIKIEQGARVLVDSEK